MPGDIEETLAAAARSLHEYEAAQRYCAGLSQRQDEVQAELARERAEADAARYRVAEAQARWKRSAASWPRPGSGRTSWPALRTSTPPP